MALFLVPAGIGAVLLGLYLSILKLNNGTFTYTLDDSYIDLALSDQLHLGNYGINPGLHAAPASSILYPFLLVPASGTPLHPYMPLLINCLALFATIFIMQRYFAHLRLGEDTFAIVTQAVAVFLIVICLNIVAVVFTGLEHSLHIAATAACIYGLALFLDNDKIPIWLPAVVVSAPLLRYEGLTLSFAVILVFALRGKWRTAAGSFALIALLLGSFSVFLVSLKLAPMPSSVLTKSAAASQGVRGAWLGLLTSFAKNAFSMARNPIGFLMLVVLVAAAVRCLQELPAKPWRWTSRGLMALALLCLIGGHAAAGQFGWLNRYEDYAVLGTVLMGLYLIQDAIRNLFANRRDRLLIVCAAAAGLSIIGARYIWYTIYTPIEANNIYEQQFQMHRFVNGFWRAPVAVNDLGLVSYHNPHFVLDLGGLASEQARTLKLSNASANAYRDFIQSNDVHLVIVYDEWFPGEIPSIWKKAASMDLSRKRMSAAESEVQFYATDTGAADKLLPELEAFRKSLPPGVRLTVYKRD